MRSYFILFSLTFCTLFLKAQNIIVSGTVKDENNFPLEYVSVKLLKEDSIGIVKYFALTNREGFFSVTISDNNQKLWLQMSMVGYLNYNQPIIDLLHYHPINFVLKKFIGTLPEIQVQANSAITKHGDTTMYRVSAFEKGNENNLSDLLKKLPGISIDEYGRASFNGKVVSKILLEEDDLFGSNYAALTNNSNINGIERIDVIENYKDNSRLENVNSKGEETVINLKYKKKPLRLFSNISVGGALAANFYELKTSNTGIINKNKFVFTANKNTIGILANRLMGLTSDVQLITNENEKLPTPVQLYNSPMQFADIKPLNISDNRIFSNSSNLVTLNHLIKLNKKVVIKLAVNSLFDNYIQTNSTTQTINNPILPITLKQNNITTKNNTLFNLDGEINWQPSNTFQTIIQFNNNNLQLSQNRNGQLFVQQISQIITQQKNQQRLNIVSTKLIDKSNILSYQFVYNSFNLGTVYKINNPILDSSYGVTIIYTNLLQNFNLPSVITAMTAKYLIKKKSVTYSLNASIGKEEINFKNSAYLFNNPDSLAMMAGSYYANGKLIIYRSSATLSIAKTFSDKFSCNTNISILNAKLTIEDINQAHFNSTENIFLLPTLSLQYKISNKKNVFVNGLMQPVIPTIMQLNNSTIFSGISSINKGVRQFNFNTGYSINASYLFLDPLKSGIIFNTIVLISNSPPNYINNLSGRGLLSFNESVVFNKKNFFTAISSRIEKNLPRIKSWFIISSAISNGSQFMFTNTELTTNKTVSGLFELRFKTNWNKFFNINSGLIMRNQSQQSLINDIKFTTFNSSDFISNTTASFKVTNKFLLDIQNDCYVNHSYNTTKRNLNFTDIQVKYILSKKINIGLLLRNIFNQKSFSYNEISPTQNISNDFLLTPFFGLLSLQIKF